MAKRFLREFLEVAAMTSESRVMLRRSAEMRLVSARTSGSVASARKKTMASAQRKHEASSMGTYAHTLSPKRSPR